MISYKVINLILKLLIFILIFSSCNARIEDYSNINDNIILEDTLSVERVKIPTH